MKITILFSLLICAFSTYANADELCGTLGSHIVAPHCDPGQICPRSLRLQYDLTTGTGERIDLETSSLAILEDFSELRGQDVCVTGTESRSDFEVTSISH